MVNLRFLVISVLLSCLGGCMNVSDMASGVEYHLRDAGLLDYSKTQRLNNFRLQADSYIYIAQGAFVPVGHPYARPNVVAEEAFKGFVEYFPRVRRADKPEGFDEAMAKARQLGAHYVLYTRFAGADDRIGTWEEWEDQDDIGRVGRDRSVVQMMLVETATFRLVDTARIRSRGGFLTFYDERPEDLLGPALNEYAQRLLGLGTR
ncbi:DUF4823 domain-containing protein [Pseudomonas oryzihabitans]|jgi:hypothetical protein|uniref:DUF4823 domain-containing protein n=1 Tax=Pseudomonas oryzihabitans TaxID=47885 RepID=UPI000ED4559B|nr:DUF4823 domain-containing protein [Pseudomonas oryzihabitans]HAC69093.1 DUF4823 domain-containing protein [Pseudomonas sp.]